MTEKRKHAIPLIVCILALALGLLAYFAIPAGQLHVNTVDLVHDFTPRGDFTSEDIAAQVKDAFEGCSLWRTPRGSFPAPSGTDVEMLMTGGRGDVSDYLQIICYQDGSILIRTGDNGPIFTTYRSEVKDAVYAALG